MATPDEKREQEQRQRRVQPPEEREPREGIEDESQERNEKVDREQFGAEPGVSPDEPAKPDESQERNEEVDALIGEDSEDLGLRSEKDGGFADEELPVVRVGEVYEDIRPSEDDHRRYVKVVNVFDEDAEEHAGKVLVQNEETYQKSYIGRDRFTPRNGWARFAS